MRKFTSLLLTILLLILFHSGCTSAEFSGDIPFANDSSPIVKAHGIDVSKWQGEIDWKKVKDDGIDFAMIRIGYRGEDGKIYKDEYADYNIQKALDAGLLIGIYFFSTAVSEQEATEEALWTFNNIKYYPISYPVAYNCEGYTAVTSRMKNLSVSQRTDNAIAFMTKIKELGYEPMMYSSVKEYLLYWDTSTIEKGFKIWVARYSEPSYPKIENPQYIGKYDMWQYSNTASISGINGNVDVNVSYFLPEAASAKTTDIPPVATLPNE